jgi:hypothetical protein
MGSMGLQRIESGREFTGSEGSGSFRAMPLAIRDLDSRTPLDRVPNYTPMPGPKPGVQPGPSIWDALREANLIGRRTRGFYQNFAFSVPGAIWGIATTCCFGYIVAVPDPALVEVFGRTCVVFTANMSLFISLCGNFAVYGSKWFLESKPMARALDQCMQTLESDPSAGGTFNANKWDFDTPLRRCRFLVKLLTYFVLLGLVVGFFTTFCPAAGWHVYMAAVLTSGFFFMYLQGYIYVVDLILILSMHSVMHLLTLLESDPLSLGKSFKGEGNRASGKFRFWREFTEKHKAMSAMFESIWEPAIWVIGPHVTVVASLGTIGLAGSLQGAKHQEPLATAVGLATLLGAIVGTKRLMERMAFVTDMCMSTSLLQRSVTSLVISRCGECPWGWEQLQAAGYSDSAEERMDQDRCLHYVSLNHAGTRIFGYLLDSTMVTRFSIVSVLGYSALLFYVAGALDLGDSLLPEASMTTLWEGVNTRLASVQA